MYKEISISGKTFPMECNGSTPIRYKQVFREDFLVILAKTSSSNEEMHPDLIYAVQKLAYIMYKQALKEDMARLSVEGWMMWMEQFGPMDMIDVAVMNDILSFFNGDSQTTAEAKKKDE